MFSQKSNTKFSPAAFVLVTGLFLHHFSLQAQVAEMWLDSNTISIGDPVLLTIDLKFTEDTKVDSLFWPTFGDSLSAQVEVLNKTRVDTLRNNPANEFEFSLRQVLTITSWDSGYHAIPPVSFLVLGDTLFTRPVLLHVISPEVDTTAEFKDIADIYDIQLTWLELLRMYWYIPASAIVLSLLLFFVIKKLRKKNKDEISLEEPQIKISPSEKALGHLEQLHNARMWQQGMVKEYYSELTGITREYLEEKFGIKCLEATTAEILHAMRKNPAASEYVKQVRQVLDLGDMAKFAKQKPVAFDNENAFQLALDLVQKTKTEDLPSAEK